MQKTREARKWEKRSYIKGLGSPDLIVFRRFDGKHFHSRDCAILKGKWFYLLDYRPILLKIALVQGLHACPCMTGGITRE